MKSKKEESFEREIAETTSFYLGGRGGATSVIGRKLKEELEVTLTGGVGAGTIFNDCDNYGVEIRVNTVYGEKKIVLKIFVEDVK
jgi:hypothetical protein